MDEQKKKQLNEAITVLRNMCNEHACICCPFYNYNCDGPSYYCDFPSNWRDIK